MGNPPVGRGGGGGAFRLDSRFLAPGFAPQGAGTISFAGASPTVPVALRLQTVVPQKGKAPGTGQQSQPTPHFSSASSKLSARDLAHQAKDKAKVAAWNQEPLSERITRKAMQNPLVRRRQILPSAVKYKGQVLTREKYLDVLEQEDRRAQAQKYLDDSLNAMQKDGARYEARQKAIAQARMKPYAKRTDAEKALVWQSIPENLAVGMARGPSDVAEKASIIANGFWRSELSPEYQASVQALYDLGQGAPFASFLTNMARAGAASYYSAPGRIAGISDDVITQGEIAKAFLPDLDNGQYDTIGKLYVKEAKEHPEVVIERDAVPVLAEVLGARVGASTKLGRGGGFRSGVHALEPAVPYWARERAASFRLSGNDIGISAHDLAGHAAAKTYAKVVSPDIRLGIKYRLGTIDGSVERVRHHTDVPKLTQIKDMQWIKHSKVNRPSHGLGVDVEAQNGSHQFLTARRWGRNSPEARYNSAEGAFIEFDKPTDLPLHDISSSHRGLPSYRIETGTDGLYLSNRNPVYVDMTKIWNQILFK